jgi:hypothetical protein
MVVLAVRSKNFNSIGSIPEYHLIMKDIYLNQTTQASLAKSISNLNDATTALADEYVLKGLKDYEQVKVNLESSGFNGLLQLMNATTGQPIVTQNQNNCVLAFTALPDTNYAIRVTGKDPNTTGDYVLKTSSDGTTTASSNTTTQVVTTAPNTVTTITDNSISQAGGTPTGENTAAASSSTILSSASSTGVAVATTTTPIALSASTSTLNPTTVAPSKLPTPPIALSLPTVSPPPVPTIGVNPPAISAPAVKIDSPATPPAIPAMPSALSISAPLADSPTPPASNPVVVSSSETTPTTAATLTNTPTVSPVTPSATTTTPATNTAVGSTPAKIPAIPPSLTIADAGATTTATGTNLAISAPATTSTTVASTPTKSSTTTPSLAIADAGATTTATGTPPATTTIPAATNTAVGSTPAKIPAIPPSLTIADTGTTTTPTGTSAATTSTSNPAPLGAAPIGTAITPSATPATFTVGTNNLLNIQNGGAIQFTAGVSSAAFKNEMGAFIVDDEQGRINGILPSAAGYLAAAMSKSQVIGGSTVGVGGNPSLNFPAGSRLGFYLVQNGTTAQVKADLAAGKTPTRPVFFHTGNTDGSEHLKITQSGNNVTFAWEDTIGGGDRDFNDLVIKATLPSTTPLSIANAPGAQSTIDLRDISGVKAASVTVGGSSSYDNFIGFYRVDDASGKIGTLDPSDAGYAQAALGRNVILYNKTAGNATPSIEGGGILAPYMIANGTPQDFLAKNPTNQGSGNLPHVYFGFVGANPDKAQHIQLLGDNKFGFEDTFGGGDRDFNDVTAQFRVTT